MAERQFGPYRLVRQIAVGGMAEIHLAKTAGIAGFEKYVALKMIHPNFAADEQFIQMLVDEAKIAVQLTHGNIAQTFDLGRVGDTYYITMEYVDGADLYKILRRASEQDTEMPLDLCAFVGKEISSALDHAHRKRDHTGKSLGIVHRDVSPQNVLVSYSGEVKLVDFGIAKATMKVRQTAVGVIKGKYYYMSPEQAWGDPIDHRSDIFSAGIVLYEMITGQMLYLEEDLHKLLEMARSADIAPPSKLRRGVPPQLERIVMHALEKVPGERYQSAGDLATDLERFLHAYSPVFTSAKLANLLRQVVGDPLQVPDHVGGADIEFRDGVMSTHPLDDAEVAHATDRAVLRDENSVIFRVSELENARRVERRPSTPRPGSARPTPQPGSARPTPQPGSARPTPQPGSARPTPQPGESGASARAPSPRPSTPTADAAVVASAAPLRPTPKPSTPVKQSAPRVTRPVDPMPLPLRPAGTMKLPTMPSLRPPTRTPTPVRPREPDEDTRRLESAAPVDPLADDSGIITSDGQQLRWGGSGHGEIADADADPDSAGERTLITGAPIGFMVDASDYESEIDRAWLGLEMPGSVPELEHVEATLVTGMPTGFAGDDETTLERHEPVREARVLSLDNPALPARAKAKGTTAPAALAANIHVPAVSELRKPRPSRRTPAGGSPSSPNVLHAIVSAQVSEPMPAPRPAPPPAMPPAMPPPAMPTPTPMTPTPLTPTRVTPSTLAAAAPTEPVPQLSSAMPGGPAGYSHDASGLPMTVPTPPGMASQPAPGGASHPAPYGMQGAPSYAVPSQMSSHGYPQLAPGALYQLQPPPQPARSLTSQMQLLEVDELPPQYRIGAVRRRWFTYIASGTLAVVVAAAVTFVVIRSLRETRAVAGSVEIDSVPGGAAVFWDETLLLEKTSLTIPGVKVGSRHAIRIVLPHYVPHRQTIEIPDDGQTVKVAPVLKPLIGKIAIDSVPSNAEIYLNGQLVGRTPKLISDVDIDGTNKLELRLKDYQPLVRDKKDLAWSLDGKLTISWKFVR